MKLSSPWEARTVLAKAKQVRRFEEFRVFISPSLGNAEQLKQEVLKKRRELIECYCSQPKKIVNLKLYVNGREITTGTDVNPSRND